MKFVFVSTRTDVIGGSNVHIRDIAKRLMQDGHDVHVLGGQSGMFSKDLIQNGIPYTSLKYLIREVNPLKDLAAVTELRSALRYLNPDIVSLHTAKAGTIGRLAAIGLRKKVLYTPHGWTFAPQVPARKARLYAFVERLFAPLAHKIVNVCETDRALALTKRVGSPAKNETIHNGMPDIEDEFRSVPNSFPPRLVMLARFEDQKDHPTLLHALAGCTDLEWSLDLAGTGPKLAEAVRLTEELGLSNRVRFLGHWKDVAALLAQAQVFLLISNWEGFPRSILEAMRAGLPVITSDVGGAAEAVKSGVTGWVVPVKDRATLTASLREALQNPETRLRLGNAGRASYASRFTFEEMYRKHLQLYESL